VALIPLTIVTGESNDTAESAFLALGFGEVFFATPADFSFTGALSALSISLKNASRLSIHFLRSSMDKAA
jgi:hypothetical protein